MTHGGRRRRFSSLIPACPTAVGHEILPAAASGCSLPPWPARVSGGWPEVPPSVRSSTARRFLIGPNCVPGLESFFLGFWELKSCFGARVFIWYHKLFLYRV